MSKKKLTAFQMILRVLNNQRGNVPDPDPKPDPDHRPDPQNYSKDFVEKLLREKNNFKTAKEKAESDLAEALKSRIDPKPDPEGGDKYKELLRAKDEDNKKLKDKLDLRDRERTDAMKLGTLKMEFDKNGGNAKQWELIQKLADVNKILIDEDTQVVYGAESEVKRIKELAPEFFGKARKSVNDGDTDPDNSHYEAEGAEAAIKALDGKRLKKSKEGVNPMVAFYAAQGLKITPKRQ